MPEILVNGERREILAGTTLAAMIRDLGREPRHVFAEVNGEVAMPADYERLVLKGGDRIELVAFVGGG